MKIIPMPDDCTVLDFRFHKDWHTIPEIATIFGNHFWHKVYPKMEKEYWSLYIGDYTEDSIRVMVAARMPLDDLKGLVLGSLNPKLVELSKEL